MNQKITEKTIGYKINIVYTVTGRLAWIEMLEYNFHAKQWQIVKSWRQPARNGNADVRSIDGFGRVEKVMDLIYT